MTGLERKWAVDLLSAFAPDTSSTDEHNDGRVLAPLRGEVDYLAMFDRMRRGATRIAAFGLRAALWIVALAPLWQRGRLQTLSTLSIRDRAAALSSLLSHHSLIVRELTLLLKLCAAMALFAAPGVRARSAYDDVSASPANQSGLRLKHGARGLVVVANDQAVAREQREPTERTRTSA
jgi:hypothetical protein